MVKGDKARANRLRRKRILNRRKSREVRESLGAGRPMNQGNESANQGVETVGGEPK